MPDQLLQMNMVVSYFNLYSIAGRIIGAAGIILVVYSVMTAVSYTHLDVYKRQGLYGRCYR